ncbi:alpha/beta fold hydrolase [Clostridium magnum]|uniref:alpha/beta fold hydrolase n=1 Tax=Clostridium magnum TaxID=33954 RepID=UPI00090F9D0D|nr:alpha/beta fold hydrolase [Clostridium magnum]SHH76747.1 alpha/beta hydrolase fold [Clostridium magnum DSM 2767]
MKKLFMCIFTVVLALGVIVMPSKVEAATKEKYVNYKGVKVYTESYNYSPNAKEAIIFLHGLGGNHSHAEFLYNDSNPYMTISLDYLDHGNSGHVPTITWDNHLGSIKAVLDAYGIKKAHIVGHSFGADTAMMFAKKYPEHVKDVVLLDRAYFNFKDYEKFNITKNLMGTLEYDPKAGLSKGEFSQYVDMLWDNDITKTWKINKDVLLIGGNGKNFMGLDVFINALKSSEELAEQLGFDPKVVAEFPDMTEQNVLDLVDYLRLKINQFPSVNKRFSSIQTDYAHGDMVRDGDAMNAMRNYVVEYLTSENKQVKEHKDKKYQFKKHSIYEFNFLN